MPYDLDVRNEFLSYTAHYARPAFELWGQGGTIMKGLYGALSPHGAPLANFQVSAYTPTAADPPVTVRIGQNGACRFMMDKLELTFSDFTEEFFRSIPKIFEASMEWIRKAAPALEFSSHQFTYLNHSVFKKGTVEEFLKTVSPTSLKSAGASLGNGVVFNHVLRDRGWVTQLVLDRSALIQGGLYMSLVIWIKADVLNYDTLLVDGRSYWARVLRELDLSLPELSE